MEDLKKRILGIDLGEKRVGLALSDELLITSSPLKPILNSDKLIIIEHIKEIIESSNVAKIIVGYPVLLSGIAGSEAKNVENFVVSLKKELPDIEIILQDERFSSFSAKRMLKDTNRNKKSNRKEGIVDSISACIILDTYLRSI